MQPIGATVFPSGISFANQNMKVFSMVMTNFVEARNGQIDFDCFYTLLVADDRLDANTGRLKIVFKGEKDYVKAQVEYDSYGSYPPSFQCKIKDKNLKNITKAKDISTEDMICSSDELAFKDNLFSSLYQAIIKGNPKLKMEARNIAREMLRKRNGKCNFKRGDNFNWIAHIHYCIFKAYSDYIFKLASFLYQADGLINPNGSLKIAGSLEKNKD